MTLTASMHHYILWLVWYRLRELAQACYDAKECLVCTTSCGDIVLVPRAPRVACEGELCVEIPAIGAAAELRCQALRPFCGI